MRITWLKGDLSKHKPVEISTCFRQIREKEASPSLIRLREYIPLLSPDSSPGEAIKIPALIFSSIYKEGEWMAYTGLLLIEFNRIPTYAEACQLRDRIIRYKQPFLTFVGSSNHSVKVVVRYTLPDGKLPISREEAIRFHAHAYIRTALHYEEQFGRKVMIRKPDLKEICRLSHDPNAFYNPGFPPLLMEQPLEMPSSEKEKQTPPPLPDVPLATLLPGMEQMEKIQMLYQLCIDQVMKEDPQKWKSDDSQGFLQALGRQCLLSGIPEENTVQWILRDYHTDGNIHLVRQTIRNIYQRKQDFGKKPAISSTMNLIFQLEEFMKRRYIIRRNQLTDTLEYRENHSFFYNFRPVTEEVRNGMCMEAHKEGLNIWDKDIKRYLYSPQIPLYNPLQNFISQLPEWDGTDRIRQLAATVPTDDPEWPDRFYKWFIAMVTHWVRPNAMYGNSLVPILTGGQGVSKSVFFRRLLPPVLQDYFVENINPENKTDTELLMAHNLLINIDEFDRLNRKHQADLKHLIQKPNLKIRKPHQKHFRILPRLASFCATANPSALLTDPSGSRRYICVQVTDRIDIDLQIDYKQLYAQALNAFYSGGIYWMTPEEEQALTRSNFNFQDLPLEVRYVFTYFRLPEPGETAESYSALELLDRISRLSRRNFSNTSARKFSEWLQAAGIEKKHTRNGNVFQLVKIERT